MASKAIRDTLGLLSTRVVWSAMGVVSGIILARWLGPHDRGVLALVLLLPSTLVTLVKFGAAQANVYVINRLGSEDRGLGAAEFHSHELGSHQRVRARQRLELRSGFAEPESRDCPGDMVDKVRRKQSVSNRESATADSDDSQMKPLRWQTHESTRSRGCLKNR